MIVMRTTTPKEKVRLLLGNIRSARQVRNYTQDYVAAKIGISDKKYSRVEHGVISIPLSDLLQIAGILDLELIQLIKGEGIDAVWLLSRESCQYLLQYIN
jgi:transcriptional regulator with XRE-family HTH domain